MGGGEHWLPYTWAESLGCYSDIFFSIFLFLDTGEAILRHSQTLLLRTICLGNVFMFSGTTVFQIGQTPEITSHCITN